jgi:hypothetical protein
MGLEDRAALLSKKSQCYGQTAGHAVREICAEMENLYEIAGRLKAKLENCYVKIKRYTVRVAAEEMRIAKSERERPVRERRNRLKGRESIPSATEGISPVDIPQVFRNTPVVTPQEAACLATSQKFSRALSI